MKQLLIVLIILSFSFGCGRKNEPSSDRAILIICEQSQTNLVSNEIVEQVDNILSQKPNSDEKDAYIALDPSIRLILDDADYMIEQDEIILMDNYGTRTWVYRGIQKKLIRAKQ